MNTLKKALLALLLIGVTVNADLRAMKTTRAQRAANRARVKEDARLLLLADQARQARLAAESDSSDEEIDEEQEERERELRRDAFDAEQEATRDTEVLPDTDADAPQDATYSLREIAGNAVRFPVNHPVDTAGMALGTVALFLPHAAIPTLLLRALVQTYGIGRGTQLGYRGIRRVGGTALEAIKARRAARRQQAQTNPIQESTFKRWIANAKAKLSRKPQVQADA